MAEKRRDSKGRNLRNGEVQRTDGKYMFRYQDPGTGERKTVYSWKLVEADAVPAGKRCDEALRTMEKRIMRDIEDGINTNNAKKVTVNMLFDKFILMRTELKDSTRGNYVDLYNTHVRNGLGKRLFASVKYSDIFRLYMDMSTEKHLKISTIQKINATL